MKNISLIWISLGLLAGCPGPEDQRHTYDLVIYGNNSAGVMAGIQARRDGLDVIVTGPDKHLINVKYYSRPTTTIFPVLGHLKPSWPPASGSSGCSAPG